MNLDAYQKNYREKLKKDCKLNFDIWTIRTSSATEVTPSISAVPLNGYTKNRKEKMTG